MGGKTLHTTGKYAGLCLLLLCALTSCSLFQKTPPKKAPAASKPPQYTAADFVEHVSLAQLALADDPPNAVAAAPDLTVLQEYSAAPKTRSKKAKPRKPVVLDAVVLECKNGQVRKLVAPIHNTKKPHEAVLVLVDNLSLKSCALTHLWPARVTLGKVEPLKLTDATPEAARDEVRRQLEALLGSAARSGPLAEAKALLTLTRVFIDNRKRDAAYITIDNAKQALVAAEKRGGDEDEVNALLKDAEALESELHKAMPFTF